MNIKTFILFLSSLSFLHSAQVLNSISQEPIANATIRANTQSYTSNEHGQFTLEGKQDLQIRALGYKRLNIQSDNDTTIHLEPFTPKALYLSYWALSSPKYRRNILSLIHETEINTLVLDVKNSYGDIAFRGTSALAKKAGAYKKRTLKDIDSFMKTLKEMEIYTIARVVLFKDSYFAKTYPEDAILTRSGAIWSNKEGMAWANPYSPKAQQYNLEIAVDVAKKGFDEIQFDYVRFPAYAELEFEGNHSQEDRVNTIISFLKKARIALNPTNTFISIDTYGYACWHEGDTGIGHDLKALAPYTDYISPMLYPSSFHVGIPGLPKPLANPYKVIFDSLKHSAEQSNISPIKFRPWLQAFKDYAFDRRHFKGKEIRAQIEASEDFKTSGWLLWNPVSKFSEEGLQKAHLYEISLKKKESGVTTDNGEEL